MLNRQYLIKRIAEVNRKIKYIENNRIEGSEVFIKSLTENLKFIEELLEKEKNNG